MTAEPYYILTPCCAQPGVDQLFFIVGNNPLPTVPGTYQFNGLAEFDLVRGECYTVTEALGVNLPYEYFPDNTEFIYLDDACGDPLCFCPCYLLIPCDNGYLPIVSNTESLSLYVNQFVSISGADGEFHCVYVIDYNGDTLCGTAVSVTIDPDILCPCPTQCYFISNASGIVTVNSTEGLVELTSAETYPYVKLCSDTYPLVDNITDDYLIVSLGDCIDGVCPQQCYKLVNCQDPNLIIYTNSDSVLPYLYGTNSVVEIIGRNGCWTVENLTEGEICDCPIDVIITNNYANCQDCIGYISYKLTACVGNDIIYTLDDLSQYVNNTIKIHCGCYTVEKLNILPSNPQTVVIDYVFDTCLECTRPYWKLSDCSEVAEDIYTYTDISAYTGDIIKIEGCDTCWQVSLTETPINPSIVNVTLTFTTCEECNVDLPCQCSTMTNSDLVPKTYLYLDCDYNYVEITLNSGETSDKVCAIKWISEGLDPELATTDCIQIYGLCQFGVCPHPEIKNNRTIRPGYNTPGCDPDRYDEITCHFADIMYKIVLEKRYGITNCCPDDDEKWLLLKELIDLQALKDPNYTCPDCPCTCNSGKSYSSCNCGN